MQASAVQRQTEYCFFAEITTCSGSVMDGVCEGHAKEIFKAALR